MRTRRSTFAFRTFLLAVSTLAGCSAVQLSPEYSDLLDKTAALSDQTAARAEAGGLSATDMTVVLRAQSNVWQQFRNARDGKGAQ